MNRYALGPAALPSLSAIRTRASRKNPLTDQRSEYAVAGYASCFRYSFASRPVDDFVTVVASKVHQILLAFNKAMPSYASQITSNYLNFNRFHQRPEIWFGTRGSEVQILSPRPIFSNNIQTARQPQNRPTWFCPRWSSGPTRINAARQSLRTMQDRLQNRLQHCSGKTRCPTHSLNCRNGGVV